MLHGTYCSATVYGNKDFTFYTYVRIHVLCTNNVAITDCYLNKGWILISGSFLVFSGHCVDVVQKTDPALRKKMTPQNRSSGTNITNLDHSREYK